MSKKKKDIYKEEMEVENYHTTYEAGSLKQGTLSWKNVRYEPGQNSHRI